MKRRIRLFAIMFMMVCSMSLFFATESSAKVIYTGNNKVDAAVEVVIKKACKGKQETMTKKEQLKACYTYLVKNFRYSHSKHKARIKVTKSDINALKASVSSLKKEGNISYSKKFKKDYSYFLALQGTCKHMSGAMCIIANHLGYKAGYVTGRYVRSNGSSCEHWWNYIVVNGKKYGCDVQAANDSWKRHHKMKSVNGFYLKNTSSKGWKKHHRWKKK